MIKVKISKCDKSINKNALMSKVIGTFNGSMPDKNIYFKNSDKSKWAFINEKTKKCEAIGSVYDNYDNMITVIWDDLDSLHLDDKIKKDAEETIKVHSNAIIKGHDNLDNAAKNMIELIEHKKWFLVTYSDKGYVVLKKNGIEFKVASFFYYKLPGRFPKKDNSKGLVTPVALPIPEEQSVARDLNGDIINLGDKVIFRGDKYPIDLGYLKGGGILRDGDILRVMEIISRSGSFFNCLRKNTFSCTLWSEDLDIPSNCNGEPTIFMCEYLELYKK